MSNQYDIELLVHKNLTGQITGEEKQVLDLHLENEDSRQIAANIESIWSKSSDTHSTVKFDKEKARQAFFNKVNVEKTVEVIQLNKDYNRGSNTRWLYSVAAIASMFLIGFFVISNFNNSEQVTFVTNNVGQKVDLPDGSIVTLSRNSKLEYNKASFSKSREIDLNGVAMFEVAKTGSRFVVNTPTYAVEVLGTTFTVESGDKNNVVKVLEGKVKVQTKKESKNIIITDRQGANITSDEIQLIENVDFSTESWMDPEMSYQNAPLSKVVSDIETKFGVKFQFRPNHDIKTCNFSSGGSLKSVTLDQIINILESALDAKIQKKESNTYAFQVLNCR